MFQDNVELLQARNPGLAFKQVLGKEVVTYRQLGDIPRCECLFLHGASVEAVEKLLGQVDLLCVLDDVWAPFLEKAKGEWFVDERIEFYDTASEGDWLKLAWRTLFKPWKLVELKEESVKVKLQEAKWGVEMSLNDYKDFGVSRYQHMKEHWQKPFGLLSEMKGALKGEAAILCGAGPSLKGQLEALKACKGHIFAGGRALQILHEAGVGIDFAGVIDPLFEHEDIEQWVAGSQAVFYQDRVIPSMSVGKRVWCGVGEGYPLLDWFYGERGFYLDPGWNVLNFLTSVAKFLGCDPIVFVGQDLKYEGGSKYAIDVEHVDNMARVGESKPDFMMAAKWVAEQGIKEVGLCEIVGEKSSLDFAMRQFDMGEKIGQFEKSLEVAAMSVKGAIEALKEGSRPHFILHEVELKEAMCYAPLLRPCWQLYRASMGFMDGGLPSQKEELCQFVLYKRILGQYGIYI